MDHRYSFVHRRKAITRSLSLAFLLFIAPSVCALDPGIYLSQYGHTAWRVREGYFSSAPLTIAQTKDGELWIGGEDGLIQFDGLRFVSWKPPEGTRLPDKRIFRLLGSSDGSLWIGTGSGLARWQNGKLTVYAEVGRFAALLEDRHGTIWAGHTRALDTLPPLCRIRGDEFKCFRAAAPDESNLRFVGSLQEDGSGNLWVGGKGAVCRWQEEKPACYEMTAQSKSAEKFGVYALASDSNGDLWADGGPTGIWRLVDGQWKRNEFVDLKAHTETMLSDRGSGLWIGDLSNGLIRLVNGRTERFTRADGLSGDAVNAILQDREGNVWVATSGGLDRFRDVKIATLTPREGLPFADPWSITASRDGSLWIGGDYGLVHMKPGKETSYELIRDLPSKLTSVVFEDSRGQLWVGVGNGLVWREHDRFHQLDLPKCDPATQVIVFAEDVEGSLWAGTTSADCALIVIRDDRVSEIFSRQQIGQTVTAMAADPGGGMWLAPAYSSLKLYRNGRFESHANDFPKMVRNMFSDQHGLWAATSQGLALYKDGKLTFLNTKNGLPCDDIEAALKDDNGALWLKSTCGLVKIPADELGPWLKDPTRRIPVRVLDAFDGAQAGLSSFTPHATTSTDGRLWFAISNGGIQVIDPLHLVENPVPPPVQVVSVVAGGKSYELSSHLLLPSLTRDLVIGYTAYSLVVPEKVQFRYRLEGADGSWKNAGTHREAFFANLKPGTYKFSVTAANNDGVWNDEVTSLTFVIPPAFYQTNWFLLLCIVSGFFVIWFIHRLRVRQVARAINAYFDVRLAERTRIARELHDTLLQTVQGSKLVADNALEKPNDARHLQQAMKQLSGWLGQATQEGRAALNSLRTASIETNDLAAALRRDAEESVIDQSIVVKFSTVGIAKDMHPIARDEIYRIGYEALRNACEHASASELNITLTYAQDLTLRVKDNGSGIEASILTAGRPGHFGRQGMRERAERIQSKLTLISSPDSGTEITLVVPGNVVFRKSSATRLDKLKTFFGTQRPSIR